MDAMESILSRRSIRKYTVETISEDSVTELLKAAMSAPSAHNGQPWSFVVITERKILDAVPGFHPYAAMLKSAPLAVAVCGDSKMDPLFWEQDCSAATENMLLAAHALGLGAVWLAIHPYKERTQPIRQMLSLPENIVPLCLVSIGHPDEQKPPAQRYDTARVHHNSW
jgi:nitroreductase